MPLLRDAWMDLNMATFILLERNTGKENRRKMNFVVRGFYGKEMQFIKEEGKQMGGCESFYFSFLILLNLMSDISPIYHFTYTLFFIIKKGAFSDISKFCFLFKIKLPSRVILNSYYYSTYFKRIHSQYNILH